METKEDLPKLHDSDGEEKEKTESAETPTPPTNAYFLRPLFDLTSRMGCSNPFCPKHQMFPLRQQQQIKPTLKVCKNCHHAYYCSADCQRVVFKEYHKPNCPLYKSLDEARAMFFSAVSSPQSKQHRGYADFVTTVAFAENFRPTFKEAVEIEKLPNFKRTDPEKREIKCIEDTVMAVKGEVLKPPEHRNQNSLAATMLDDDRMFMPYLLTLVALMLVPNPDTTGQLVAILHAFIRANNPENNPTLRHYLALTAPKKKVEKEDTTGKKETVEEIDSTEPEEVRMSRILSIKKALDVANENLDYKAISLTAIQLSVDRISYEIKQQSPGSIFENDLNRKLGVSLFGIAICPQGETTKENGAYCRSILVWAGPQGGFVIQRLGTYFNIMHCLMPNIHGESKVNEFNKKAPPPKKLGLDLESPFARNMDLATLKSFFSQLAELTEGKRTATQRRNTYYKIFALDKEIVTLSEDMPLLRLVTVRLNVGNV
jgi:hypothetical protein